MLLRLRLLIKKLRNHKRNYIMTFHKNCRYEVSDNDLIKILFKVSDELRIEILKFNFNCYTKEVRIRCRPSEKMEFMKGFIAVTNNLVEDIKI